MQTPEETLANGSGSCRDSGWLLVQLLRHLGLAARFVSGYLIQLTPDVKALDGPSGTDGRLHRPARLVRGLPARRRLDRPGPDLGPAGRRRPHPAGLHAARRRAPRRSRAWSTRPRSSSATTWRSRASTNRRASPSPTPTSSGPRCWRWATRSTRELQAGDVRLTMGGEPTFVAIGDRDAAEWNTDALGPDQARLRHRTGAQAARPNTARAASCTSARASGTRASSCRAGRCRSSGAPTASRAGTTRRCSPTSATPTHYTSEDAQPLHHRAGAPAGPDRALHPARLRRRLLLPVARAPAAGQRRPVRLAAGRRAGARAPAPRVRRRSSTRWSATCCRSRRPTPSATRPRRKARAGRPAPGSCATTGCT